MHYPFESDSLLAFFVPPRVAIRPLQPTSVTGIASLAASRMEGTIRRFTSSRSASPTFISAVPGRLLNRSQLAVPPLAATLAYDTGVPVSADSEDGAVRSRDQQLSTAGEAGCAGGGAFGFISSRALCMATL